MSTTWNDLEAEIEKWLIAFAGHVKHGDMTAFKASGYARKTFDLKEVRNIIIGLTGYAKPWEFAVGQTISKMVRGLTPKDFSDNKVCNFLGTKFSNMLRP